MISHNAMPQVLSSAPSLPTGDFDLQKETEGEGGRDGTGRGSYDGIRFCEALIGMVHHDLPVWGQDPFTLLIIQNNSYNR